VSLDSLECLPYELLVDRIRSCHGHRLLLLAHRSSLENNRNTSFARHSAFSSDSLPISVPPSDTSSITYPRVRRNWSYTRNARPHRSTDAQSREVCLAVRRRFTGEAFARRSNWRFTACRK